MGRETLIIAVPSHDSRAVIQSLLELMQVGQDLGRAVWVVTSEASNIPRCRNLVLDRIRERIAPSERPWVLWVDSDMVIPLNHHAMIARAIEWAESHEKALVANYLMANGRSVMMRSRDPEHAQHYSLAELEALPPYAEIGMSGLGFVYLRQPNWRRLLECAWRNSDNAHKAKWEEQLSAYLCEVAPLTFDAALGFKFLQALLSLESPADLLTALVLGDLVKRFLSLDQPNNTHFVSFSRTCTDILRWSRYSSMHRGHCLIFKALDGQLHQCPRRKKECRSYVFGQRRRSTLR